MSERNLSIKQQRFIQLYDGNGTKAAREAGYTGSDEVLSVTAARLLGNARVLASIQERESKEIQPGILSRLQRKEFWSRVLQDETMDMGVRLRASELLAKSEADFTYRMEIEKKLTLEDLVAGSREDRVSEN